MTDPSQDPNSQDTNSQDPNLHDTSTWKRLASRRLLTHGIAHNGVKRTALVYVPQHVRRRGGLPLVVLLHGGASSAETIARRSAMHVLAEREGFIVAYPKGTPGTHGATWNPAGNKAARKTNDTRFLRGLIGDLQRHYEIDPHRIFLAGFSIGGSLVYELAGLMADEIAAMAIVSGTMTVPRSDPRRPVPLIHIHGTADRRVPLEGGRGPATQRDSDWSPVQVGIDRWREINGCTGAAEISWPWPNVARHRHVGAADVELWLVEGGAHVWPGAQTSATIASASTPNAFAATEAIWRFFAAQPRRRRPITALPQPVVPHPPAPDPAPTPTALTSDGAG